MEILKEAHDFSINNLYASDGGGNDVVAMAVLKELANAACLGAGHQSDERYDAPKCHPETRAAVINDIMSWVNDKDSKEPIMWMSGPAGAGKSAIAQTVCEKCFEENKLLASFFFSRTATGPGRSEANRLVPTIACQLAIAILDVKPIIIEKLNNDAAMLTYAMEKQMQRLVLEPLAAMYMKLEQDQSHIAQDVCTPYVVVIDGLDECNNPKEQSRIVRMISAIYGMQGIQLRFFIASRPELEIRNSFDTVIDNGKCATIVLNESYKPDDDIRTYLHSEFDVLKREHTLRKTLQQESDWPSSEDIYYLVEKSSGQFIYASTVIKYLRDQRRDPRQGLRAIRVNTDMSSVQTNASEKQSPYTPLDLLYRHILDSSSADYDSCKIIFQILLFAENSISSELFMKQSFSITFDVLSSFTGMTPPDLEILLADFHSILHIPNKGEIKFYHASFGDFLKDMPRSGLFYIAEDEAHKYIAQHCLAIILKISPEIVWSKLNEAQSYSVDHFFNHLKNSDFDEELLTFLRSETTLHAVLNVLSKCQRYNSIKYVIEFSFDGKGESVMQSQPYWIPRKEKIQDVCLAIVKFVEDRFLFRIGLNDLDVIQALYYRIDENILDHLYKEYYFAWLLFLLESPIHGKQIYLNSKNSFILYKKFIQETDRDTLRHYFYGEEKYYPLVLKYLLMRIQPSAAYTESNLFPRSSEEVLNEIIRGNRTFGRWKLEQFIKDLHGATEIFLEKCQKLKKQEEEEMKLQQEEDLRRQQEEVLRQKLAEEELKRQQEEEIRRQQEDELRREQEDRKMSRRIKNCVMKLKDKFWHF